MKKCKTPKKTKRSLSQHRDTGNFKTHRPSRGKQELRAINYSLTYHE